MNEEELTEGKKLKVKRILKGYSQVELAKKSGICETVICQIENEKRKPRESTLEALYKALE